MKRIGIIGKLLFLTIMLIVGVMLIDTPGNQPEEDSSTNTQMLQINYQKQKVLQTGDISEWQKVKVSKNGELKPVKQSTRVHLDKPLDKAVEGHNS